MGIGNGMSAPPFLRKADSAPSSQPRTRPTRPRRGACVLHGLGAPPDAGEQPVDPRIGHEPSHNERPCEGDRPQTVTQSGRTSRPTPTTAETPAAVIAASCTAARTVPRFLGRVREINR